MPRRLERTVSTLANRLTTSRKPIAGSRAQWGMVSILRHLALIALTGLGAPVAAQTVAPVEVAILTPTALVKTGDLDFGTIISGPTAGEVTINPGDDNGPALAPREVSGGVTAAGGSPRAASFITYGSKNSQVSVELEGTDTTLTRLGGTETMAVVDLNINGAGKPRGRDKVRYKVGPGGLLEFRVGGTLRVGPAQPPGDYRGRFSVTTVYK